MVTGHILDINLQIKFIYFFTWLSVKFDENNDIVIVIDQVLGQNSSPGQTMPRRGKV